jgi:ABC-2 type transport system ATP-binding protein
MNMNMENVISVSGLTHRFGEREALNGVSFNVRPGEVFALLGPNGAGKTTTIRLLNGLYTPSVGNISVLGLDPAGKGSEIRKRTGVLTETNALYERLTARENLHFFGALYGLPESVLLKRIDENLSFFALQTRADDRVGTFSKGMKQRLALARALLTQPEILFLDEPTSSLDPESALQVHELIQSIRRNDGHTVFLCTHRLDEAERLADRVAILNNGRLLDVGTIKELKQRLNPGRWVEIRLAKVLATKTSKDLFAGLIKVEQKGERIRAQVREEADIPVLVSKLVTAGAQIISVEPQKISLEEIYFKVQNKAREGAS